MMVYMGVKGELKRAVCKVKRRSGGLVMLGGVMGGGIGMRFYVLGVKYMGGCYRGGIWGVYGGVGGVFGFIFLKDRVG